MTCGTTPWLALRPGQEISCHAGLADTSQHDVQLAPAVQQLLGDQDVGAGGQGPVGEAHLLADDHLAHLGRQPGLCERQDGLHLLRLVTADVIRHALDADLSEDLCDLLGLLRLPAGDRRLGDTERFSEPCLPYG